MNDLSLAFILMGYGLVGVFSVLILFYFVIRLLTVIFPQKNEN